jgi:Ca2+/H+ antiporter
MRVAAGWLRKHRRGIQIAVCVALLVVFCVFLWINAREHGPAASANKNKGKEAEQRTLPDANTISTPPGQAGGTPPGSASPTPTPATTPTDANTGATPVN